MLQYYEVMNVRALTFRPGLRAAAAAFSLLLTQLPPPHLNHLRPCPLTEVFKAARVACLAPASRTQQTVDRPPCSPGESRGLRRRSNIQLSYVTVSLTSCVYTCIVPTHSDASAKSLAAHSSTSFATPSEEFCSTEAPRCRGVFSPSQASPSRAPHLRAGHEALASAGALRTLLPFCALGLGLRVPIK